MTKELLQQALDALTNSIDCVQIEFDTYKETYGAYLSRHDQIKRLRAGVKQHKLAITAIESAIAQHEARQDIRQPLTDEQIAKKWRAAYLSSKAFTTIETYTYFARAIETAHGIKATPQGKI